MLPDVVVGRDAATPFRGVRMTDGNEDGGEKPQTRSVRGVARASALLAFLGLRARKEQRSRHPQIVRSGPEVDAVVEVAEQLAGQGREDDDAVRQLRAAANGRRGVLNRALALSRMGPKDAPLLFEVRSRERMDRLLVAAATREPVPDLSRISPNRPQLGAP